MTTQIIIQNEGVGRARIRRVGPNGVYEDLILSTDQAVEIRNDASPNVITVTLDVLEEVQPSSEWHAKFLSWLRRLDDFRKRGRPIGVMP